MRLVHIEHKASFSVVLTSFTEHLAVFCLKLLVERPAAFVGCWVVLNDLFWHCSGRQTLTILNLIFIETNIND